MNRAYELSMNIAIIGHGSVAESYAAGFALAGHNVFIGALSGEKEEKNQLPEIFDNIYHCTIQEASSVSDLIIIATSPKHAAEAAYWIGDIDGRVIIDATSNVEEKNDEQLNTMQTIAAITGCEHIVKVFDTNGCEKLVKPLFKGDKVDMILAGDSKKAKAITKILGKELGARHFYDLGGVDSIQQLDELTKKWRAYSVFFKSSRNSVNSNKLD